MFFDLESFLLIPDVCKSSFFVMKHIPKYVDHGKILCFFKDLAFLMLFRTICKSLSVWSHRRFTVHFMTMTMVAAILKKNDTAITIFSL